MDKKSYAFGMSVASSLFQSGVHGLNFEDFTAGLRAIMMGEKPAVSIEDAGKLLEEFYAEMEAEQNERASAAGKAAKEEGEKFLAENAGKRRVRPIFLTSCTTALGVLPMVLSKDILWQPMGVIICFGTILSIVFIVLLMPVCYWLIFKHAK